MKKNTSTKTVSFLAAIFFAGGIASAQSTGYMNPTDTALPHGWTNPLLGMDSDAQRATVVHGAGCNCPWIYLSWNEGANYTPYELAGPFDTTDSWRTVGGSTTLWSHAWVDSEFSNKNFRLEIENPGLSVLQGYQDFNFSIPPGATILGIEVNTLAHGNSAFTVFYLNAIKVNVYYSTTTGIGSTIATANNVELYPNPAHNNITMHLKGLSQLKYTLFSIDGRMIMERNAGSITNDFSTNIDLDGIPAGIYFVRIVSNLGTDYKKIVVQ